MSSPKRKKPPRLEIPKKQYALNQCALYGIKGTQQLLSVLKWTAGLAALKAEAQKPGTYSVWTEDDGRVIQAACPSLRLVHSRIAVLMRRVLPPEYRQSGIRGLSFITNAAQHCAPHASLKLDVRKFYPSTKYSHVRSFFVNEMHCAPDIAGILAHLCCYQGAIPTGGVHSEVLAFYCHKVLFDELEERVRKRGGRMTVYVDDIMVTMPNASHTDLMWSKRLFASRGMRLHPGKSGILRRTDSKVITGVIIKNGQLSAPPEQHRKVGQRLDDLRGASGDEMAQSAARRLLGHLDHIAQIDKRFQAKATGNRARLKNLLVK